MKRKLIFVLVFLGIFNTSRAQSDGGKFSLGLGLGLNYFYPESAESDFHIDPSPGFVIPFPWGKLQYDFNNGNFVGLDVIYSVVRKHYDWNQTEISYYEDAEDGQLMKDYQKYLYTNINAYYGRYIIGKVNDKYNFYIRGGMGLFAFDQKYIREYYYKRVNDSHIFGTALTFNVGLGLNIAIGTNTKFFAEYTETFGLRPFNNSPKFDKVATSNRGANFGIRYMFN
jgi:hypothetical protein